MDLPIQARQQNASARIGQTSAIKLGRAREIASEHHAKVKLGRDPAGEKRVLVERVPHIRRTGEEVPGPATRGTSTW